MMTSVSPSCVCNTHTRKHKDDHRLELIAQSPIKEGEQVMMIILIRVIREVEIYFQSDQRSRNIFHDNDSIQRSRNLFFWRSGRGTRRLSWEAIREWRTWRKLGAHCFSFMINKNNYEAGHLILRWWRCLLIILSVQALHVHLPSLCRPLRVGKHDVRGLSLLLIIWLCHHFSDPVAWSSWTSSPSHDYCQLIVINLDKDDQVRCSSCSPTKSPTSSNTTNSSTDTKTNEANTNKESSRSSCPGFLLPRAPTLVGGPWTCDSCNRTLGASAVQVTF